jgi:uncharacterized protein YbbK (DUF523 family)
LKGNVDKILVSACLLGSPVRYDGKSLKFESDILNGWVLKGRVVSFCPEVSAAMSVPRPPAEIQNGDGLSVIHGRAGVFTQKGRDVSRQFLAGALQALKICRENHIRVAVLTESSPSCGSHVIHDGSFTHTKIAGVGVTAALLNQHGFKVFSQYEISKVVEYERTFRASAIN